MARKTVSVRELQQNLKKVMERVERGEVVEVTRYRRPVVRLTAIRVPSADSAWPNLEARLHETFEGRLVEPSPIDVLLASRGER